MKDPVRLRETGTDDVRTLLRHASGPPEMNDDAFARGQRRVARLAAVPVGLSLMFWLKGVALGAGIGAVAIAGAEVVQLARADWTAPPEPPSPPHVVAPPKQQVVAPAESAPAVPDLVPSSQPAAAHRGIAAPTPSTRVAQDEPVEPLAQEAALLERARGALQSDPARALTLTREHARAFPSGQLGLEREIVAVEALQKLGRGTEARARADALLRTAPGSYYEERVRNLLPEPR